VTTTNSATCDRCRPESVNSTDGSTANRPSGRFAEPETTDNPTLSLVRERTDIFGVVAIGHPFFATTGAMNASLAEFPR
jgi:hypothetical protein